MSENADYEAGRLAGFGQGLAAGVRICLRVAVVLGMSAEMRERILAVLRKSADG